MQDTPNTSTIEGPTVFLICIVYYFEKRGGFVLPFYIHEPTSLHNTVQCKWSVMHALGRSSLAL